MDAIVAVEGAPVISIPALAHLSELVDITGVKHKSVSRLEMWDLMVERAEFELSSKWYFVVMRGNGRTRRPR